MRSFARVRGRRWWAVVIATIGAAAIAAALSFVLPASYRAESTLLVTGPNASRELQLTYAELMLSDDYLEVPAAELGLDVAELREGLRSIPSPGTTIIAVNVTNGDRGTAIERANTVAALFGPYLSEAGFDEAGTVSRIRSASKAERTSGFAGNMIAGGAAGCIASLGTLVFLSRRERERLREAQNSEIQAST